MRHSPATIHTMTNTRLEIFALPVGREQMFSGSDPKDGWPVTASVVHRGDGMFDIEACWVGDRAAGIETFTLRRTFTQARYAAEWLDAHMRVEAPEPKPESSGLFVVESGQRGAARETDAHYGPFASYDEAEAFADKCRDRDGSAEVWASVTEVLHPEGTEEVRGAADRSDAEIVDEIGGF